MAKIQPGLERIAALLGNVEFPWRAIHVAGTNGKGSICHHASSLLVGKSLKVGKFTSPHLVDRWDCISINGKPVSEGKFRKVESHFLTINAKYKINASPFEILTATAFTIFNDATIKVGVVEVGMGGTLDSTNILNNQAVSVISKIARDHEGFLGNTLSEIAGHKAGILRPQVPYLINSANEANVVNVINDHAKEIGAGPQLSTCSFQLEERLYGLAKWHRITRNAPSFQQENIKMAVVAVMQTLDSMGQSMRPTETAKSLLANVKLRHHGRQEMIQVPPVFRHPAEKKNHVLVDGAHNPDAAEALDEFVRDNLRFGQTPALSRPESGWPVTWVLAMTEGKDAHEYLAKLLKPGDRVVTTAFGPVDGMPWVKPMDPKELLEIAQSVEPQITGIHMPALGTLRALIAAKYMVDQLADWTPIILTGSLYLVGDFHRELRPRSSKTWWTDTDETTAADRESILKIQAEERGRANAVQIFKRGSPSITGVAAMSGSPEAEEQTRLQDEIDALNREVQGLEIEEQRLAEERLAALEISRTSQDEPSLSALERFELGEQRFTELHSTPERLAEQIAKAERAEADLARQAKRQLLVAEARAAKAEKRAQQQERIKLRKERRREQKRLEQELGGRGRGGQGRGERGEAKTEYNRPEREQQEYRIKLRHQTHHPYQKSLRPHQKAYHETLRGQTEKQVEEPQDALSVLSSQQATGPRKAATRNTEPENALAHVNQKNSFFGQSSSSSTYQEAGHVSRNAKAPSMPPRPKGTVKTTEDGRQALSKAGQGVRIHMHYANVAEPRRAKMREFPVERRTRAWTNARGKSHPGYKTPGRASVVNYYAHEYGMRNREGWNDKER